MEFIYWLNSFDAELKLEFADWNAYRTTLVSIIAMLRRKSKWWSTTNLIEMMQAIWTAASGTFLFWR